MRQQPIAKKNQSFTADKAFHKYCQMLRAKEITNVLDVGAGKLQPHATKFREMGLDTFTADFYEENDYRGMFIDVDFDRKFDAVWCAHTLEHQENVGLFLRKINEVANEGALISITVPPMKHGIVGGHLTFWNLGLLYYNLILAGFDCSKSIHKSYTYNLSVIFEKKTITDMPELYYDNGDIELLGKYFPCSAIQGFNGQLRCTF